jgi:hypothetical protein
MKYSLEYSPPAPSLKVKLIDLLARKPTVSTVG